MLVDFNMKENKNLKKDCLFIWDGKQAIPVSKNVFLKDELNEIDNLKTTNTQLNFVINKQNEKITQLENNLNKKINAFIEAFKGGQVL